MSVKVTNATSLNFLTIDGAFDNEMLPTHVKRLSKSFASTVKQNEGAIERGVSAFDQYFQKEGFTCPLPRQLDTARRGGLPGLPPLVRALLSAELTSGVLMGLQDRSKLRGHLQFRYALDGEEFEGREGTLVCGTGEPVVSDDGGVIASLFQGPDLRTSVTGDTNEAIFYLFSVPDLDSAVLELGIAQAIAALPWSNPNVIRWPGL